MQNQNKGSTNRLAVFQHVTHKRNTRKRMNRAMSPLSDSESDHHVDVSRLPKRRNRGVRLVEEPLKLVCLWRGCPAITENYDEFVVHVSSHAHKYEIDCDTDQTEVDCDWNDCSFATENLYLLKQHLVYHAYLSKLQNIGNNVLQRLELPQCTQTPENDIPLSSSGYTCEWKHCSHTFANVYDFFEHAKVHVNCFPKYCKEKDIIECEWIGCSFKCNSQYKLADHLRSHTKERVVACPTCGATFATKTKFHDHRKRQLPVEEQSYQCSQCSKVFPSERLLKDHIRSHVNHYKCTMCDMTCPKPSALAAHVRFRHFPERPLKCTLCDHKCVLRRDLQQHLLTHCTKKLFACEECDFCCRSLYGLDRHYQKVHKHAWTQTYECHCCGKRFFRGNYLTTHLIKDHGFHWPSGHSRFRYKEDTDGIYRLQTVRYESLEVTQEMMNSKNVSDTTANTKYDLRRCDNGNSDIPNYVVVSAETCKNVLYPTNNSVLITINDVDEQGNIVSSEVIESNEIAFIEKTDSREYEETMFVKQNGQINQYPKKEENSLGILD